MSTPVLHPLRQALGYCALLPGFLSPAECRELVARAEAHGFRSPGTDYPPTYRTNDRLVQDDERLSKRLFAKLRGIAPEVLQHHGTRGPESWRLDGVNERLRFCRYTPGQQFNIHQDGVHHRAADHRSMLTFMVYLTDPQEFCGGDTLFFAAGPEATPAGAAHPEVIARVRPAIGTLILFDHGIWHAGETVTAGTKHILRSDVLYRNDSAGPSLHARIRATSGH